MKIKAEMGRMRLSFCPQECIVEKVAEIPGIPFDAFMENPTGLYGFIKENEVKSNQNDRAMHCLLVLCEGRADGILVECGGYGDARCASYIPSARDVVQAKLDRAVDFIVRQGTEHTSSGYWCIYCEELEERFGLTIPEGSGLDAMLKDALERRPEVATVEIHDGAIETTFHPEFCEGLCGSTVMEKPDIRVRDILPLMTGRGLAFLSHEEAGTSVLAENLRELTGAGREDHAALLDARVAEICPSSEGLEIVLTDVAPEELARFNEAYDAFQEAEQAMGPAM